jgi:fumarate hydratase class II
MSTRIERDSLGEKEVPHDAYYGIQTVRAVENFPVSGLRPWAMAAIKRAAAEVNHGLELLDEARARAISNSALEVMQGRFEDQFLVDPFQAGAGTSHNMNTNEVIANRAIEILGGVKGDYSVLSPNDHVNMSQSTNDTIPTAIRLGCLWRLDELLEVLDQLGNTFEAKADEFDEVLKSGRTHLQDAVPIRMGQEFGAYAKAIRRDRERIDCSAEGLRRLGIGGTAVGTGLNAHPHYHAGMVKRLSEITGLTLYESDNLFESMQSLSDAADFSGALRVIAMTLTRIANDIRLLSSGPSTGLDEIRLPAVQPGSSIMPGKVNPVLAEMLNQAMFHVQGCDHTVALAAQAGQLELNVMMPIIAHNLFEMMQVMIGAVRAFDQKCVQGITVNPEKAASWLANNPIIATALNPLIGYLAAAELVKEAMNRNLTIRAAAVEGIKAGTLRHKDENRLVTVKEVDAVLGEIHQMTEGGIQGKGLKGTT